MKVIQIEKHVGESMCLHRNLELRSYLTRWSCFSMQQLNKAQHNEKSLENWPIESHKDQEIVVCIRELPSSNT